MKLSDRDRRILHKILRGMERPVRIVLVAGDTDSVTISGPDAMARDLVEHLTGLTSLITVQQYPVSSLPGGFVVERTPTLALETAEGLDTGIRYVGVPSGYQFGALVDTLLDVSRGAHRLEEATLRAATRIGQKVRIRVYYLPSCPHSPRAVRLAHMLAWYNPQWIQGQAMDASLYADAAAADGVQGVPTFVFEREPGAMRVTLEGGQSEAHVAQTLERLGD